MTKTIFNAITDSSTIYLACGVSTKHHSFGLIKLIIDAIAVEWIWSSMRRSHCFMHDFFCMLLLCHRDMRLSSQTVSYPKPQQVFERQTY